MTRRLVAALVACLTAFGVLTCLVRAQPAGLAVDRWSLRSLVAQRSDLAITVFRWISHLGDPTTLIVLAIVAGAVLARRHTWVVACAPAVALLAGSITEATIKVVIGRDRPPMTFHLLHEADQSFPSGHTTGTAALFMTVALLVAPEQRSRSARIGVVVGAGLVAAAVGLSRMFLGVHWLTDVAAGWFLGTSWAIAIVLLVPVVERRVTTRRAAPAPAPALARSAAARTLSGDAR